MSCKRESLHWSVTKLNYLDREASIEYAKVSFESISIWMVVLLPESRIHI